MTYSRAEGAVQVQGLEQALKGLGRANREVRKQLIKELRLQAKRVALEARKVDTGAPSEPSNKTRMVFWRANNKGSAVVLRASKEPRAYQTEFGAEVGKVGKGKGRLMPQEYMSRRRDWPWIDPDTSTYSVTSPLGKGTMRVPGTRVIGVTIARNVPRITRDIADTVAQFYRRVLKGGY